MPRAFQIFLALVLAIPASAQTFVEGDYQLNRKKATAGFEVAELLAGDNITFGWNNTNKTLTITGSAGNSGTVTSFSATDSTGIDFTVTNPTTTPTLSLALTKAAVGLSNVENTALSTWAGTTALTTLGTITTGTWNGSIIAPAYLGTGTSITTKYLRGDGTWQTIAAGGTWGSITGTLSSQTDLQTALDAKLATNGDGSALTGITAAQVGAVANGDSPTFDQITLTNGIVESPSGALSYNYYDTVNSTAAPLVVVTLYDDQTPPQSIGASIFGFRGDGAGSGTQFFQGSTNNFHFEGVGGSNTATVYAAEFNGSGASLTNLDASNLTSGTLAVAYGGSGRPSFSANSVLLGNGTSPLNEVLPGTTGNVLTSNGTTWTSTAPTVRNPAGSGSELQYRSTATAFGDVNNSSVSGGTITLGNAEALGTTPTAYLTLRNTTAATSGNQQVSPSIVREGRGFATTGGSSQTVRFRDYVLPVQGSTNPSATWVLQNEINNSGTWSNNLTLTSASSIMLLGNGNGTGEIQFGTTGVNIRNSGGGMIFFGDVMALGSAGLNMGSAATIGWASTTAASGSALTVGLGRDANNTLAQRNGTNAQIFRLYETDSGANDEYLELSAASGTNLIRPQATGTGTASVVRYHTTTTVFWTSGSGSPESVVTAPVGSLYTRTDGGAGTTLYVKESGTGSTGWVAK